MIDSLREIKLTKIQNESRKKNSGQKQTKNKIVKKEKTAKTNIEDNVPETSKVVEVIEKPATQIPQTMISNPLEKLVEPNGIRSNQSPITASNRFFYIAPKTNYFIIFSIILIMIFMVSGYFLPATQEDIAN